MEIRHENFAKELAKQDRVAKIERSFDAFETLWIALLMDNRFVGDAYYLYCNTLLAPEKVLEPVAGLYFKDECYKYLVDKINNGSLSFFNKVADKILVNRNGGDEYTLDVTFSRYISEDTEAAVKNFPGIRLNTALLLQFWIELQNAYEETTLSGGWNFTKKPLAHII